MLMQVRGRVTFLLNMIVKYIKKMCNILFCSWIAVLILVRDTANSALVYFSCVLAGGSLLQVLPPWCQNKMGFCI